MRNGLAKFGRDNTSLSSERRLMNEALARLNKVEIKQGRRRSAGRLIFGLDLTGSREHSLGQARIATAAMFDTIASVGAIAVRLIYYRGSDECRVSPWHADADALSESMRRLACEVGRTQIERVLRLALEERETLSGVVFVGDHCEEDAGELKRLARMLGQKSIPLFIFHECADDDERSLKAKPLFKMMAAASSGEYVEFKRDSGVVLREMLSNVAAFSAGGAEGLKRMALPASPEARQLQGRLLLGSGGQAKQAR